MIVTDEQIDALDECVKFATAVQARDTDNTLKLPIHKAHDAMRRLRFYASVEKSD